MERWRQGWDLGKWDPSVYFNKSKDPIRYEIEKYQKFLLTLRDGTRIDGNRIKGWWTTRQKPPLRVTSADKVTREVFDVFHWAWGILQDRKGKVTRSFEANMNGKFENNILTLEENFYWKDGEKQKRIWNVDQMQSWNFWK